MRGFVSLLDSPVGNPCTRQYTPARFVSECFNSTCHRGVSANPQTAPLPRCAGSLPANTPKTSSGESAQRLARLRLQPASVRTRGKSFLRGVQAPGAIATSRLSESWPRVKLIVPNALEWRNWQTQQTQNLPPVTRHGGSTPPSSIWLLKFDGKSSQHVIPRSPRWVTKDVQGMLKPPPCGRWPQPKRSSP